MKSGENWRESRVIVLGVLGGLVVTAFLACALRLAFTDIAPPDDTDLIPVARDIDETRNPVPALRSLSMDSEGIDARMERARLMKRGEESWDRQFGDALLRDHTEALSLFRSAAEQAGWQIEPILTLDYDVSYLNEWMKAAKLMEFESLNHAQQGDQPRAVESALTLLRFAEKLEGAQGSSIHQLVGITIASMGHHALVKLLDDHEFDEQQLKNLQRELARISIDPEAYATCFRVEYRLMKNLIEDIASGALNDSGHDFFPVESNFGFYVPRFLFKKNQTIKEFADVYRALTRTASMRRSDARNDIDPGLEERFGSKWRMMLSTNAIGNILLSVGLPEGGRLHDRHAMLRVSRELLGVRIALERYFRKHGRLPSDLSLLIPEFLDTIPADSFDGDPVRYDPAKRVLYSVGMDLEDDDGVAEKEEPLRDKEEIVLPLGFTETSN